VARRNVLGAPISLSQSVPTSFDSGHRRSRVQPIMGGIELVIPSQIGFATVFLGVWLCGWTFGEVFATREVSSGTAPPFLYIWLLGWTLGGGAAFLTFLWALLGRERVLITRDQLVLVYECGWWRRVLQFDAREIRALRVIETPTNGTSRRNLPTIPLWGNGSGPLAFDYGFRTIHLAEGVSPAEARVIASEITEHARLSSAVTG